MVSVDDAARQEMGHKRKLSKSTSSTAVVKRTKTSHDGVKPRIPPLPSAVMQRIMLHLSPAMLMRFRRVSRECKYLLEDVKPAIAAHPKSKLAAQVIDSESIWSHARRQTYPHLPRPLLGISEADMLMLITRRTCMNCERHFEPFQVLGALNSGPGIRGARPIWQFRTTVCGPCLRHISVSEIDFLKEQHDLAPGILRRALAYVFVSRDANIVSEATARGNNGQGIVKIFSRDEIATVLAAYNEAKSLGDGAVEEWKKGLDDMGKDTANDVSRWARFEDLLAPGTILSEHMRDAETFGGQQAKVGIQTDSATEHTAYPHFNGHSQPPQQHDKPALPAIWALGTRIPPDLLPTEQRPARDQQEAEVWSRQRQRAIERLCRQLPAPIECDLLQFMPSFKNSMQIKRPLSQEDWTTLLPLLENDREAALEAQYQDAQRRAVLGVLAVPHADNKHHQQYRYHQNRDVDRGWAAARGSLRNKLAGLADDIINGKWFRTTAIDQHAAPFFAAEVLHYVYTKYYEEVDDHPGMPKLVLDDLKWLFDEKVRDIAERDLRDIFACAGCHAMEIVRWCAFEGLIQHYGAKHEPDFGKNNITVDWQSAEWPEEQPFVTDLSKILKPRHIQREQRARLNGRQELVQRQRLLSDNPMFSQEKKEMSKDEVTAQLARDASEVWNKLDGVEGMPNSIRVWATLQTIKTKYEAAHKTYLSIETFSQALGLPVLHDLRMSKELSCRSCPPHIHNDFASKARLVNKKCYNLMSLLTHFSIAHLSAGEIPPTSWTDFLDLPSKTDLEELPQSLGMSDEKLLLIDRAFSHVFPKPRKVGMITDGAPVKSLAMRLVDKAFGLGPEKNRLTKRQKQKKKADAAAKERTAVINDDSRYDPSDPALPSAELDPSMFDSALRKEPAPYEPPPMRLETLLAANGIVESMSDVQRAQLDAPPSPLANTLLPRPKSQAAPTTNAATPNIAAIIAALQASATGASASVGNTAVPPAPPSPYAQIAAPVQSMGGFSQEYGHGAIVPAQPSQFTYPHTQYDNPGAETTSARSWYTSGGGPLPRPSSPVHEVHRQYTPSVPASNGHDLLAALTQNSRSYEQARSYHTPAEYGTPYMGYQYDQTYAQVAGPAQYAQGPYRPPQLVAYGQAPAAGPVFPHGTPYDQHVGLVPRPYGEPREQGHHQHARYDAYGRRI